MIHWKNKPIDTLSTEELRQALGESVRTMMQNTAVSSNDDLVKMYTLGVGSGVAVALTGMLIATLFS